MGVELLREGRRRKDVKTLRLEKLAIWRKWQKKDGRNWGAGL